MFRQGLQRLLEIVEDFDLISDASDGDEAVQQCITKQADILLLDTLMLRVDGFKVLSQLSIQGSQVQTLLLTTNIDQASLV